MYVRLEWFKRSQSGHSLTDRPPTLKSKKSKIENQISVSKSQNAEGSIDLSFIHLSYTFHYYTWFFDFVWFFLVGGGMKKYFYEDMKRDRGIHPFIHPSIYLFMRFERALNGWMNELREKKVVCLFLS